MKQFAVIGASTLGKRVLDELIEVGCEIILVDKDPEVIEQYKNDVTVAYVANVISKDTVKRLIPSDIDAAVVDMGSRIEASILVTQYLKQLGVGRIIVKAETKEHGEILDMVGAEHVVFPNLEAARRITPLLISDLLFQYLPISSSLVVAEVGVPAAWVGRAAVQPADVEVTIMGWKRMAGADSEYEKLDPVAFFEGHERLLVCGGVKDVEMLTYETNVRSHFAGIRQVFLRLLGQPGAPRSGRK